MGNRSHSRERERHRSRSPVARSKPHRDERKGKSKHHVKKEHHRDKHSDDYDRKVPRRDPDIRVKSEPDRVPENRIKSEPNRVPENRIKSEPNDQDKKTFGSTQNANEEEAKEPEKPSMALSGKLLEDTNVFNGVVIKYSEPEEARKPKRRWRFYVFKGEETLPVMHIHRQSAYLVGKDRKIADIPVDHPSCSRQHAVLQYRMVSNKVRPYVIDLGSSNGTYLNNQKIDPQRYVELREKDVVKFGYSSREYVLLHDTSAGQDD